MIDGVAGIVATGLAPGLGALALAALLLARVRRGADRPPAEDGEGGTAVPVRQLRRIGPMSRSQNGFNPRLRIEPEGLRFRVLREDVWPFAQIVRVDAQPLPWVFSVTLEAAKAGRLVVELGDSGRGRAFLRALPQGLPLTPRAQALRDGAD